MDDSPDLAALFAGERSAWDAFIRRYAAVIHAAVLRKLLPAGRGEDAEDVAQDVFVKLCREDFRLLRTYDPARAKLSTWLTVMAVTSAIDHLRRHARPRVSLEEMPEALGAVEQRPRLPLRFPPGLLTDRQAAVLRLLYEEELEVAEAASLLGIDPQTVRSLHHKALTRLRAEVKREAP